MKPILIVMCGLQCSGKSTKAKELQKEYEEKYSNQKTIIISSDQIRKEYPELDTNEKVFNKVYFSMNYWLRQGDNVILDATEITIKSRKQIFSNLQVECEKICYIMNTPYDECLKRLKLRNENKEEHFVPEDVLEKYYKSFEIPFYPEGWDKIIINTKIELESSRKYLQDIEYASKGFNQKSKWHNEDLYNHHFTTVNKLRELIDINIYKNRSDGKLLLNAILLGAGIHDIGKLFTQTMGDEGYAHYYNHENVGAYELLCNMSLDIDNATLFVLFIVNYHMKLPYLKTEKSIKKYKKIFGEKLYNILELFAEADKYRKEDI